jgi:ribosomal protein S18 acetylase RimI-like enzyme
MRPRTPRVLLRQARLSDLPQIRRISGRVRARDYVPRAFPRWVRDPRSYTMVAEQNGRVIAVARARLVTPGEAWGQGIRVDPASQGLGIGRAITLHWPNVLHRRGARVARVAVLAGNRASLRMMVKSGFRITSRMIRRGWWRRLLPQPEADGRQPPPLRKTRSAASLWRRIQHEPASRHGRLVLAGDYYTALTLSRVAGYVRRGDAYEVGRAFCLVDRRALGLVPRPGWWIVAMGGPPRDAAALARAVLTHAWRRGARALWIDAGHDRKLLRALERAGFAPPPAESEVVVMEARLPLPNDRAE